MELAGFYRDKEQNGSSNARKSLAEMTRAELEEVVSYGAAVLVAANKAQVNAQPVVDITPNTPETLA